MFGWRDLAGTISDWLDRFLPRWGANLLTGLIGLALGALVAAAVIGLIWMVWRSRRRTGTPAEAKPEEIKAEAKASQRSVAISETVAKQAKLFFAWLRKPRRIIPQRETKPEEIKVEDKASQRRVAINEIVTKQAKLFFAWLRKPRRIIPQREAKPNELKASAKASKSETMAAAVVDRGTKLEVAEIEARQQPSSFETKEGTLNELTEEVEGIYRRLLSSLEDLLGEVKTIETRLKSEPLAPREHELVVPVASEPPAIPLVSSESGGEPRTDISQVMEHPIESQEEAALEVSEEKVATPTEPVAETAKVLLGPHLSGEEKSGTRQVAPPLTEEEKEALYVGEVELLLAPSADLTMLSELHGRLLSVPELHIMHTVGSWSQGVTIALILEKPLPLVSMLSEIAILEARPRLAQGDGFVRRAVSSLAGGSRDVKRITITSKARAA